MFKISLSKVDSLNNILLYVSHIFNMSDVVPIVTTREREPPYCAGVCCL